MFRLAPKLLQYEPRGSHNGSRMLRLGLKLPQYEPRGSQNGSQTHRLEPKLPQYEPRSSQNHEQPVKTSRFSWFWLPGPGGPELRARPEGAKWECLGAYRNITDSRQPPNREQDSNLTENNSADKT